MRTREDRHDDRRNPDEADNSIDTRYQYLLHSAWRTVNTRQFDQRRFPGAGNMISASTQSTQLDRWNEKRGILTSPRTTRRTFLCGAVGTLLSIPISRAGAQAPLTIATSMPILQDIVAHIAGDAAEVFSIMPSNVIPTRGSQHRKTGAHQPTSFSTVPTSNLLWKRG